MEGNPSRPGIVMPLMWVLGALLLSVVAGAWVGWSAYHSESAGVSASLAAVFPVTFVWSGTVGAVLAQLMLKGAARVGVPFGCGCLGGVVGALGAAFFFGVIFPAL